MHYPNRSLLLACVMACGAASLTAQNAQRPPAGPPRPQVQGVPQGPQPGPAPARRTAAQSPAAPTAAPVPVSLAPVTPFTLSPAEQAEVERALAGWEQACSGINDIKCEFHRIDDSRTFGTQKHSDGEIKYKRPDKARYLSTGDVHEQYFCDGTALYQWDYDQKQLIQHILPEDMRGAAIADGPLPFLFTATAAKLKNRYFLRVVTPPAERAKSAWIEAYPRHQQDAANFSKATVILDLKTMLPSAVETFDTNLTDRTVHTFASFLRNDKLIWLKGDFNRPMTPLGWKFVVDDPLAEAAAQAEAERASPRQAVQPRVGPRR